MKAYSGLWLVMFFGLAGVSQAMMSIGTVTKERAEKMGIVVTAQPAGPDAVWVTMSFKTVGELKTFGPEINSRVELWIREGEKLFAHVPMQMKSPSEGEVRVTFVAARKELKKMSLMVIVGAGLMPGGAYEVRLEEFVDLEKLDVKQPKKPVPPVEGGGGAPATGLLHGDFRWPEGFRDPEVVPEEKKGIPLRKEAKPSKGLCWVFPSSY